MAKEEEEERRREERGAGRRNPKNIFLFTGERFYTIATGEVKLSVVRCLPLPLHPSPAGKPEKEGRKQGRKRQEGRKHSWRVLEDEKEIPTVVHPRNNLKLVFAWVKVHTSTQY